MDRIIAFALLALAVAIVVAGAFSCTG